MFSHCQNRNPKRKYYPSSAPAFLSLWITSGKVELKNLRLKINKIMRQKVIKFTIR